MADLGLFHTVRLLAVIAGLAFAAWMAFTPVSVVALDDRSFGGECGYFWQQGESRLGDPTNRCAEAATARVERIVEVIAGALAIFLAPALTKGTNRIALLITLALLLVALVHVRATQSTTDVLIAAYLAAALAVCVHYELRKTPAESDAGG